MSAASMPCQRHPLPQMAVTFDRKRTLLDLCRGSKVLHLGCVASDYDSQPGRSEGLLHRQILRVARRAYGVDINAAGLESLRRQGIPDLIHWDVHDLERLSLPEAPELIVAGEVIEHLPNPGRCLGAIAGLMRRTGARLLITVPNAFSLRHFLAIALQRTELVMPDHVAYYSVATLRALLAQQGLRLRSVTMYWHGEWDRRRPKTWLKRALGGVVFGLFPQVSEGIIAVAEPS